jgi:hypothetical protein
LKKATGIESSGLLSFHLGKLTHLVSPNQQGAYELTDQGKEAVRMIRITRNAGGREERTIKVRTPSRNRYLVVIAILLATVIALGSVSVYQQNQLGLLTGAVHGSVVVTGVVTGDGSNWVAGITSTSHALRITFTSPSGNSTTTVPNAIGQYWVSLQNGEKYFVTVYWQASLVCSIPCMSIIQSTGGINDSAYLAVTANTINSCPTGGCPTNSQGGFFTTGSFEFANSTSTSAVAQGTCASNVLDLHSTTVLYTYNPLPC